MSRALPLLPLLVHLASQLRAADLTKIERTNRREPAYQNRTPRYCLLVFGPEAKSLASGGDGRVLLWDMANPPGARREGRAK